MGKIVIKNTTTFQVSKSFFAKLLHQTEKITNRKMLEVHLNLVGQKLITKINRDYRGKNRPTDTISFAFAETQKFPMETISGEIFISLPQVKINAKKYGVSFKNELQSVFVHSLLHLLGYDHQTDRQENALENLQNKIITVNLF